MIGNEIIDQIRNKTDIVEIISDYLPLTAKGKNYFGVCPFHEDHNPSMSVSKDKQIYKCFSCGASGNVYQFVMDYENISFIDAVRMLASRAGVVLEGNIATKTKTEVNPLIKVYEDANHFYVNNLHSKAGASAREYLKTRSLSEETIKLFKIGLALPGSNILTKFLNQKGYSEEILLKSGLISNNYDVFQNRILFPYDNLEGHTVAFSGRIFQTEDTSKYINTRETEIFKKGQLLYNYAMAKSEARLKRNIIVVEGVMDVIRFYEMGIKNVVAIMGSSVTKEQMQLLKRISNEIYFCLDGDSAGEKGMLLALSESLKLGLNIKMIRIPKGDPDTYLLEKGIDSFNLLKEEAMSGLDFKVQVLAKGIKLNDMGSIKKYLEAFSEDLTNLSEDLIMYNLLLKQLAEKTALEVDDIKNMLIGEAAKVKERQILHNPLQKITKVEKAEITILYYMLNMPESINYVLEKDVYFYHENWRSLFNEIIYYEDKVKEFELANFMTYLIEKENLLDKVKEVLKLDYPEKTDYDLIDDCMRVINSMSKKDLIVKWTKELGATDDVEQKLELMQKIYEMKVSDDNGDIN